MVEVTYGFFCEDLRVEVGGQVTAVGLWGRRLFASTFPVVLRSLALHFHIHDPERVQLDYALQVTGPFPEEMPLIEHTGKCTIEEGLQGQNINLFIGPVLLTRPGELVGTLRLLADPVVERIVRLEMLIGMPPRSSSRFPAAT